MIVKIINIIAYIWITVVVIAIIIDCYEWNNEKFKNINPNKWKTPTKKFIK